MNQHRRQDFDISELRSAICDAVHPYWTRVDILDEVDSTNRELAKRISAQPALAEKTVLIANHQTSGRGRHQRSFTAPRSTIIPVSVSIKPDAIPVDYWSLVSLAASLAVVDCISEFFPAGVTVKWPNDVLIGRKKVAGILAEVVSTDIPCVIVGCGLNVEQELEELPVPSATSLLLYAGDHGMVADLPSRTDIAIRLLQCLRRRIDQWHHDYGNQHQMNGEISLIRNYESVCSTLGCPVIAYLPSGNQLEGTAVAVDQYGRLVIEDYDRGRHTISAGDVIHLRGQPDHEEQ